MGLRYRGADNRRGGRAGVVSAAGAATAHWEERMAPTPIVGSRTDWVERAEWIHPRVALLEVYWREADLVALYLVEGRRRLLVDTGTTDTPQKALRQALVRLGRRLEDIDVVVNTHAHIDHAWGNGAVQAASGAEVLMHAADAPLLRPVHLF